MMQGFNYKTMRNFLLGFMFGASLLGGINSAASDGPIISGESGTLEYRIVIDDSVICDNPWMSIPEETIECDDPFIHAPKTPKKLKDQVVAD
jgi:hypothetical protein